jgi:HSP20 family protein
MSAIIRRSFPARTLTKQEFLTPFDRIFDDMINNMFPTFANDLGEDFFARGSYPKVNVINHDDKITIDAAIPGMKRSDIDIHVTDSVLTIQGNSNQSSNIEDSQYVKREIKRSGFRRSFKLGDNLDEDQVTAKFDSGILTLEIPKVKPDNIEPTVRKIEIK